MAAVKVLTREIVERIKELPPKDVQELYDYVKFLELKSILPKIDPEQIYFWTKQWQKMEKGADLDIKAGRVTGPFKSAKDLLKHLKK